MVFASFNFELLKTKIKNIRSELFKRQSYIEISDSEMEEMIEDLHVLESKCVANPMITSKQLREVCDLIDYIEQFQLVQV